SGLVFFRCALQSIVRCKLWARRLRKLERKPAICVEHQNAFWIWTQALKSATVAADVVYSGAQPSSHELLLKRLFLGHRESRQEHKSHRCRCGNTENDTSIHGLSSWSVIPLP